MNYGSYATYKTEGIEKMEWISVRDDRTRDSHAEIDGTIVATGDTFNVGDSELQFPGDPSGSGAEIINCRCTVAPVVDE